MRTIASECCSPMTAASVTPMNCGSQLDSIHRAVDRRFSARMTRAHGPDSTIDQRAESDGGWFMS